ncbi:MAG: IPExxxVDY family protein [Chitinophagaceae bacterium]
MIKKSNNKSINNTIIDNFFNDLDILGIITTLPIYTFLYYLEQSFLFHFTINPNKSKEISYNKKLYFFETYEYYDNLRHLEYYIYINEIHDKYLLPEAKSIQFLWGMKGSGSHIEKSTYIQQLIVVLMQIPQIKYVGKIEKKKIISKEFLLF